MGGLLAQQVRTVAAIQLIFKITSSLGDIVLDPVDINNVFSEYYAHLYSSESSPDAIFSLSPLASLKYPIIDKTTAKEMGGPIMALEIQDTIRSMQNQKSSGPIGFTTEFYKAFSAQVLPILESMYNDSFFAGQLPESLNLASISLILKNDKDPSICSSYRPISLLNVDVKILSKILSNRLR